MTKREEQFIERLRKRAEAIKNGDEKDRHAAVVLLGVARMAEDMFDDEFKVGDVVEVSDDGETWGQRVYVGSIYWGDQERHYTAPFDHYFTTNPLQWKKIRPISSSI
jgi:hypothetical protein